MEHRRTQLRPALNETELVEKRLASQEQLRKDKREQLLASKRRREDADPVGDGTISSDSEIQGAITKLGSNNAKVQADGLVQLRKITCNPTAHVPLDCVHVITKFLQVGERHEEFQFEAIWCLTNIVCISTPAAVAVLPAAPYLIRLLASPSLALQEQSSWCLGNLAGESAECRTQLRANGVVRPLLSLLQQHIRVTVSQHVHQQHWRIARLVAFALSNMARPGGAKAAELLQDGGAALILESIRATHAEDVAVEASWLLAHVLASAPAENSQQLLLHAGIAESLVTLIPSAASRDALLSPLLRCIGHALSRHSPLSTALATRLLQSAGALQTLLSLLSPASNKAPFFKRETCWLLANLSALSPASADALVAANTIELLARLLCDSPHDTRHEAAVALTNLSADGRHVAAVASQPAAVQAFLTLVACPDSRTAYLALAFLDLLLYYHSQSISMLPALPEALQSLQFHRDQSLFQTAHRMLHRYYGVVPSSASASAAPPPAAVNVPNLAAHPVFVPSM